MSSLIDNNEHIPSRRSEIFFWIVAVLALSLFAGRNALSISEAAWAETYREMLAGKISWGAPYNWELTQTGPVPGYWFILLMTKIAGISELTLRLPGVLAGLLMLLGTKILGKKLFNKAVSRLAGWLMLGSYGFLFWSRSAAPDILCAAFATSAVMIFSFQDEEGRFFPALGFFLLCAACGLSGGIAAFFIPGLLILPYLFFTGKWRNFLRIRVWSSLLLVLCLTGALLYRMQSLECPAVFTHTQTTPLELFRQDISRSLSAFYAVESLWKFLLTLPRLMLPWTPFFLLGGYGMCRYWKTVSDRQKGMFAGLLLTFVFLALTGKHGWGDVLPLMPFAVLITAGGMLHNWTPLQWEKWLLKAANYAVCIVASLGVAAIVALPVWGKLLYARVPWLFLLLLPLCSLAVLAVMLLDGMKKPVLGTFTGLPRKFAAPVLGAALLMISCWTFLLPSLAGFRSTRPFCQELKKELVGIPAGAMFFWKDHVPADLLFYLDRNEPLCDDPQETAESSRKFLKKLISGNAGKPVVIFSKIRHTRRMISQKPERMREKHLEELEDALHIHGFSAFDALKPDYIEPLPPFGKISSPRLAVWVLNIPETTEGKTK